MVRLVFRFCFQQYTLTAFNSADMGCLGEVVMAKDDNYAKWAVKIRVAFRDTESLEDLESHRQSGGVRLCLRFPSGFPIEHLFPFETIGEISCHHALPH